MNILNEKNRFLKFALVGGTGVIVNNGVLWLLAEFTTLPFYLCSFIAIELSILTNFLLNDAWTWRDKREGHLLSRLYRYNASTAFSSLFINMTVLLFLKEWLGMPYLLANLIGIGCGVVFNFLANSVWTYGEFRFKYPKAVWIIFFCSLAFRLLLAAGLGPGFDEAYYYAYSLRPSLSYFDHPPVVGFLAGYFPSLTGLVSAFTIRLAGVLLYSITGLLLYQLARQFVDARKATWAVLLFNITPIFFLLAGIFILPDAGLVLFWILTLFAFYRILFKEARLADWLLAGLTTGGAMLAKYHGALLGFFLLLYVLLCDRKKLLSIGFYLYGLLAFAIFSPVLIWNARHDWISFTFQSARAVGSGINFTSFAQALGGQAGYLTPMIFFPMLIIFYRVIRGAVQKRGQTERFYLFFGVLPVLLFTLISLSRPILPHWTLVGYIVLTIPLAEMIEPAFRQRRWVRWLVYGSSLLLVALLTIAFLHTRFGILRLDKLAEKGRISARDVEMDATLDMVGWQEIDRYLTTNSLSPDSVFLFTHKWLLSGQVELATSGRYAVLCFDEGDPRGYGVWDKSVDVQGRDAICIYSNRYRVSPADAFAANFSSFGATDSLAVQRGGRHAKTFYFTRCHHLVQKYRAPF
ncbi:phospholipid carrier-dependent glycosyltransferase [candidate division KSB1 bacterium]|nr:MAG: phospholipid carrier-dependent glycosyltransferase [candidate division KSB1 bacterium]